MRKEIDDHLFYWENVVKNRGGDVVDVASVLRLWSEGHVKTAASHMERQDDARNPRCSKCDQVLPKDVGNV